MTPAYLQVRLGLLTQEKGQAKSITLHGPDPTKHFSAYLHIFIEVSLIKVLIYVNIC
jgi:hypothetical protein